MAGHFGKTALAMTVVAVGLATTGTAAASADFPSIVAKQWKISGRLAGASAQGCTLCHKDDAGNYGTITRPFGVTMHTRLGVIGREPDSLRTALDDDKARAFDSDGDKISDYQELALDHTNPNDPKSFKLPPAPIDAGGGGQGGEPSTGSDGGQSSSSDPPPYTPLPEGDLPPPFKHGCALAHASTPRGVTGALIFVLAVLGRRSRSLQRRRGLGPYA